MYRAPSKRRQLIQRTIVYSAMTTGVILLVTLLVFLMLGYRFNRDTSTIQQGGLVQFNTRPTGATIQIGQAKLRGTTPTKITVNPGDYEVIMERGGYRPWSKDVSVLSGKVLWLNYAQLVPLEISQSTAANFETVAQVKASLNGKFLAVVPVYVEPQLTIVEINNNDTKQTSIELEPTVDGTKYEVKEWSYDNDRLLVTATKAKQVRWLLVERQAESPSDVIDLSAKYGSLLRDVRFDPRDSQRLVVRDEANSLRLLNVAQDAISSIIVRNVEDLSFYGRDHIMYVSKVEPDVRSIGYVSFSDTRKPRELKSVEEARPVKIAAGTYFNDPIMAIAIGSVVDVYKLSDLPGSGSAAAITLETLTERTLPQAPSHLSIRSNGRFVIMQHRDGFATYDIELQKHTLTSIKGIGTQELRWFDRHHPYVTDGKQLMVMEFDGANQHRLAELTTRFDAVQTDNGKYVYAFHASEAGGYELRRHQLILD